MLRLILNTRHARHSPRAEVSPGVLAALRPLLVDGRHPLPVPSGPDPASTASVYRRDVRPRPSGYDLTVSTVEDVLIATVYRRRDGAPLVTFGVAGGPLGASELWTLLLDLPGTAPGVVAHGADTPLEQPSETPWCGVIVLYPTPTEAEWLGDFERCLAWAWIDMTEARS